MSENKTERPEWANVGAASTAALGVGIFGIGIGPQLHEAIGGLGLFVVTLAAMGLCLAATMYLLARR